MLSQGYENVMEALQKPQMPFFNKMGEVVAAQLAQASSARPGELGCFHLKQENVQNLLDEPRFENFYLDPQFDKFTPYFCIFWLFSFRNLMELYGFDDDVC